MIAKNMDGQLELIDGNGVDADLIATVNHACATELPRAFNALSFSTGIEAWLRAVYACNQYVDEQAPWALKKDRSQSDESRTADAVRELA